MLFSRLHLLRQHHLTTPSGELFSQHASLRATIEVRLCAHEDGGATRRIGTYLTTLELSSRLVNALTLRTTCMIAIPSPLHVTRQKNSYVINGIQRPMKVHQYLFNLLADATEKRIFLPFWMLWKLLVGITQAALLQRRRLERPRTWQHRLHLQLPPFQRMNLSYHL